MKSMLEYVCAHVRRSGQFEALTGERAKMTSLNNAIAYAFFAKAYSAVVAAERAGQTFDYAKPAPHLASACLRYQIDPMILQVALASAFEDLKFEIRTGQKPLGDGDRVLGGQPASPPTFLLRLRRDLVSADEHRRGMLAIVCAQSVQELFWTVDQWGDPGDFEYSPIKTGEGMIVAARFPQAGDLDEDDEPLHEDFIEPRDPRDDGVAGLDERTTFSEELELALCEERAWHALSESYESAVTYAIPDLAQDGKKRR